MASRGGGSPAELGRWCFCRPRADVRVCRALEGLETCDPSGLYHQRTLEAALCYFCSPSRLLQETCVHGQ